MNDTHTTGYGLDIAENINPTEPQLNYIQSENNTVTEEITLIQSDKEDFNQIVFIDSTVEDSQTLTGNISGATEVIILDDNKDELIQISQHLSEYQELDAVHIVSHGESGQLSFGNTELNQDTLPKYTELLENWDNSLITEADLVFYGCDVASGEDGLYFMKELGQITGADISASIDLTGKDGDWELETKVGEVETTSIFDSEIDDTYQHNLVEGEISIDNGFDDGFDDDDDFAQDNFDDQLNDELFGDDDDDDNGVEADDYDSFADVPADNLVSLAEDGLNFAEVSPEALATIDFNNIPAEDFQVLKEAGLSLTPLSSEALANVNLGVFKNFDYLSQVDLSLTNFDELTTFGELSSTFADNANLYTYKAELDIGSGLNLDKITQLSLSDFQALDYAYLADGAVDSEFYLTEYTDVRDDGINPYTHYAENGQFNTENRYPNLVFKGVAEADEILIASANTDFQLVKNAASTLDESETVAFAPAIPLIYYTITGAVVFTLIGLETLRQANSWDEAFENSDFEYFTSPEPIVGALPGIDSSGRFVQPVPETEGDTVLKFPGSDSDSGIDTGTPPFSLEEAVKVNVLDFPNADSELQSILDGGFEFPLEEGDFYFYYAAGREGNNLGDLREEAVVNLVGGTLAKDSNGQDIELIEPGASASVPIDVFGPNGELILVGGPNKAKNLGKLGGVLRNIKIVAEARGVEAQHYFAEGTPESVIKFAEKRLGAENVFTFPEVTLPE